MHGCLTAFTGTHTTGESLFTFFASLTFSFHFLTKLFELCLWILKEYNIFIYLWKLEPDILNNSENRFEQLKAYLITKNVMQQFHSFRMLLFSFVVSWKDQKLARIAQVNQLFLLLNLIFSTAKSSVSKNVNRYLRRRQTCLESSMDQCKILEICPSTLP